VTFRIETSSEINIKVKVIMTETDAASRDRATIAVGAGKINSVLE